MKNSVHYPTRHGEEGISEGQVSYSFSVVVIPAMAATLCIYNVITGLLCYLVVVLECFAIIKALSGALNICSQFITA
jgi:hypothetical protein